MSLNYGLYTATVLHCYAVKHFVCFVIKRALVNKFPLPLPLPPSVVCCSFIRSLAARCSLTHSLTRSEYISIYGNYFVIVWTLRCYLAVLLYVDTFAMNGGIARDSGSVRCGCTSTHNVIA